jgi:ribosomal protein L11 methylase PrmA
MTTTVPRSRFSSASKISLGSYPALDVRYVPGPGTEILHDLLYAELDAFEPVAIHDLDAADGWRVFFRLTAHRDSARAALETTLGDRLIDLSPVDVDDEDWARRSQAALTAIRVGRIIVAPPWDVPEFSSPESEVPSPKSQGPNPKVEDPNPKSQVPNPQSPIPNPEIVIIIEPSMGFGTGHHATTRLCLELLQTLDLSGRRVVDLGTGSGVLAIAAIRLGASAVTAVDNDPDALQSARDNIARNLPRNGDTHLYGKLLTEQGRAATPQIAVIEADLSALPALPADVVLANLTSAVLQRHAPRLRTMLQPAGVLIISGFSPEDLDQLAHALDLPVLADRREDDWAAAILGPLPGRS